MLHPFSSSLFSSSLLLTRIFFLLLSSSGRKTKEITAKMQFMYARMRKFFLLSLSLSLSLFTHSLSIPSLFISDKIRVDVFLGEYPSVESERCEQSTLERPAISLLAHKRHSKKNPQFSWKARARACVCVCVCIKQSTHSSYVAFGSRKL